MMLRRFVVGAALLLGTVGPGLADAEGWRSADRPGRDDGHRYDDEAYGQPDGGDHGRHTPHDGPPGDHVLHDDQAPTRPYWGTTQPYWGPTAPDRGAGPPRDWRDPQRAGSVRDVPARR